jgi:hypothetical protein
MEEMKKKNSRGLFVRSPRKNRNHRDDGNGFKVGTNVTENNKHILKTVLLGKINRMDLITIK